MTDIRSLLHAAAPTPREDIDIAHIIASARRRSAWRRFGRGFAALAVIGGLGGAATGVLSPADSPQQVDVGPSPAIEAALPVPDPAPETRAVENTRPTKEPSHHAADPGSSAVADVPESLLSDSRDRSSAAKAPATTCAP